MYRRLLHRILNFCVRVCACARACFCFKSLLLDQFVQRKHFICIEEVYFFKIRIFFLTNSRKIFKLHCRFLVDSANVKFFGLGQLYQYHFLPLISWPSPSSNLFVLLLFSYLVAMLLLSSLSPALSSLFIRKTSKVVIPLSLSITAPYSSLL